MNFQLTGEQRMLQDTIGRILKSQPFRPRLQSGETETIGKSELWLRLAEQGFLALPFEAGPVETMIVMEALGQSLCLEPYLPCAILASGLYQHASSPRQKAQAMAEIVSGQRLVVLAHAERDARYDLHVIAATARAAGEGFVLNGDKILVPHASTADEFIVPAQVLDCDGDVAGITLFRVPASAAGMRRRCYRLQDGRGAGDLHLENVRVVDDDIIGGVGQGLGWLQWASDRAIAALAAEAVGAMQALLDLTVEHLQQRRQFGQPIGAFQALQHRAAEMLIETEQARSMAIYAALMVDDPDLVARRRALSQVKAQIGTSGRVVGQLGVQLHGGLGVSEEHAAGHYLKHLVAIDASFGDRAFHLRKLATSPGEA